MTPPRGGALSKRRALRRTSEVRVDPTERKEVSVWGAIAQRVRLDDIYRGLGKPSNPDPQEVRFAETFPDAEIIRVQPR